MAVELGGFSAPHSPQEDVHDLSHYNYNVNALG